MTSFSRDRRDFLRGLMALSGAAACSHLIGCSAAGFPGPAGPASSEASTLALPLPGQSGIDHIVVSMLENRSFDHLLGWHPTADGRQAGLSYVDNNGVSQATQPLAPNFTGCGNLDPDHSYQGGRIAYNNGAMDGFLRTASDNYSIGYYEEKDLPVFNALARNYTVLDRYFCSFLGPTGPNRMFLHTAQNNSLQTIDTPINVPTIWDRLEDADVSRCCYYHNEPFLPVLGEEYEAVCKPYDVFLADAASGNLPAVSFLDPEFGTEDVHPPQDVRWVDTFLAESFQALSNGPAWNKTVWIVMFDEWGGFFDHVPPPRVTAANPLDPDAVDGKVLLGFRTANLLISPFSRGNPLNPRVNSSLFDHTSPLKLIEWRWGLPPLTARDACPEIQNLAVALDLQNPGLDVPVLPSPAVPGPDSCT